MNLPDKIPPETKVIMEEITSAIHNGGTATIEELWAAWTEITARVLKLETERDELRESIESVRRVTREDNEAHVARCYAAEKERDDLRAEVASLSRQLCTESDVQYALRSENEGLRDERRQMKVVSFETDLGTVTLCTGRGKGKNGVTIKAESHNGEAKGEINLTHEAMVGVIFSYGYIATVEAL